MHGSGDASKDILIKRLCSTAEARGCRKIICRTGFIDQFWLEEDPQHCIDLRLTERLSSIGF